MSSFRVWHCLLPLSTPCIVLPELFERGPTRVWFFGGARAVALVQVSSAIGAQSATVVTTHPRHWNGEVDLLAHYFVEVEAIIPVEGDQQIILGQLSFLVGLQPIDRRNIEKIEP